MFKALKTVTLLLAIFLSVEGFTQFTIEPPSKTDSANTLNKIDSTLLWHGFYFNPVLAGGVTRLLYGGGFKSELAFEGGAEIAYMSRSGIGISVGAGFEQYSFGYKYSSVADWGMYSTINTAKHTTDYDSTIIAGYNTDALYTFNYIKIPLMLRFVSSYTNRLGLWFEAGAIADILAGNARVSGSASETEYNLTAHANVPWYSYQNSTVLSQDITGITPDAAKFNIALHVGVGIMFPVSKTVFLVASTSSDFMLTNAGTGSNDVVNFSNSTYYFFGKSSSYGGLNWHGVSLKIIFKLSHH